MVNPASMPPGKCATYQAQGGICGVIFFLWLHIPLGNWFLNFGVNKNHLESFFKIVGTWIPPVRL